MKLFNGFRILASDSSIITLPFTEELKKRYGIAVNAVDTALDHVNTSERDLALRHTHQWKSNDLIIYDRGYPSFGFIYEHIRLGVDCLIRAKTKV